jgi:tetratricopeptide (TPR) repeat protein
VRAFCFHLCVLGLSAAFAVTTSRKPGNEPTFSPGKIEPKVVCAAHPDQSYALFLPSAYQREKRWPIIYVFDPAARGMVPTEIIKEAAERYGYVVATSNNSRNGAWKPEMDAASAMWQDTHVRFSIDDQRVYTAGFSGGARLASRLAQMCKCAQGVFLNGAGFSTDSAPTRDTPFAVFMTAGATDFNYSELVRLDRTLGSLKVPHFLYRFAGSHEWAPAAVWPEALAWMNLRAMIDKRMPRDDGFIAEQMRRFTDAAKEVEKAGNVYFAAQAYRQTAEAFEGLTSTESLGNRAADLERDPWYATGEKHEREDLATQSNLENDVFRLTSALRDQAADQSALRIEAAQLIRDLRNRATHEKKEEKKRVLERARRGIFANLIETGEPLMEERNFSLAEIYLELAVEARPEIPWPHLSLARCLLKAGRKKDALQSLAKAKEAGLKAQDLADLETQIPEFRALAGDAGFQKLVEGKAPAGETR